MKVNKMITIDADLMEQLSQHGGNHSQLISELLYDYFKKLKKTRKESVTTIKEDIKKQKKELEAQQEQIKKDEDFEEKLKEDGLTREQYEFIISFDCNIMKMRDNRITWENKFGTKTTTSDLYRLAKKYGNPTFYR